MRSATCRRRRIRTEFVRCLDKKKKKKKSCISQLEHQQGMHNLRLADALAAFDEVSHLHNEKKRK